MQEISGMMGKKVGKGARGVEKGTYYVYILRCRDGSLYTGLTNDLPHRWALHVSGRGAKYTRAHPPEAVAALWRCGDKITASRLEYAIKAKLTHGQKETLAAAPGRIWEWFPALLAEAVTTLPAGKEFPIFADQT